MSFPNQRVLEIAKEDGWTEGEIEQARIHGFCEVNGILLQNIDRYRYARMQFCMSPHHVKKTKRHLKDCPTCTKIVENMKEASK